MADKKFLENEFTGCYTILVDFLKKKANEDAVFKDKLEKSTQTSEWFMSYINGEAKKLAKDNTAMVEDNVVFGWAVHFIDENIQAPKPVIAKVTKSKEVKSEDVDKAIEQAKEKVAKAKKEKDKKTKPIKETKEVVITEDKTLKQVSIFELL